MFRSRRSDYLIFSDYVDDLKWRSKCREYVLVAPALAFEFSTNFYATGQALDKEHQMASIDGDGNLLF